MPDGPGVEMRLMRVKEALVRYGFLRLARNLKCVHPFNNMRAGERTLIASTTP